MENASAQALAQVVLALESPWTLALVAAASVLALVVGILVGRRSRRRIVIEAAPPGTALLESRVGQSSLAAAPTGAYQQFLAERGVGRTEIEARMREFLDQFDGLRNLLQEAAGDGAAPGEALDEARSIIEAGAFDRAVEILASIGEAAGRDGRELRQTAERQLKAAAAVRALMGDLMFAATSYQLAARHYLDAIELLPAGDDKIRTAYLNKHGTASYNAASFAAAADSFEKALAIRERSLDAFDAEIATALNNLAMVRYALGNYEAAEPLYKRALQLDEHNHGADHPAIATDLNNLALLYKKLGNLEAAEPLLRRALVIKENTLPQGDPSLLRGLRNYASVLRALHRFNEADRLEARAAGSGPAAEPAPEAAAEVRAGQG